MSTRLQQWERHAIADELRETRASLNATRSALSSTNPSAVAMDYVDYSLIVAHLNDAEAAIFAALEVATADD